MREMRRYGLGPWKLHEALGNAHGALERYRDKKHGGRIDQLSKARYWLYTAASIRGSLHA